MYLTRRKRTIISVFLLLYYIYMNSIRKVMIPLDSVTIPAMLALVFLITLYDSKGKIVIRNRIDAAQCASWSIIAAYIIVNNQSLLSNLIAKGMIQMFVMIAFMLLCVPLDMDWIQKWILYTKVFVCIHAIATIVFFFNSELYKMFVEFFFSSSYSMLMNYYNRGWMSGLSSHFSSNGMILAIGVAFYFESIRQMKGEQHKQRISLCVAYICEFITVYALILSSKRGPFFAIILSITITYIFAQGKNVGKRLWMLFAACAFLMIAYRVVLYNVPGMQTIVSKFIALEDTDAGLLNGRSGLWSRAIELFCRNPIFGTGFGGYAAYALETNAITTSAHNYYLQVLSELGIVGLVLYIVAFINGIYNAFIQLKVSIRNGADKSVISCLSIALEIELFVVIYSMSSTSMMYYPVMIPYFLACASVRAISNMSFRQDERQKV